MIQAIRARLDHSFTLGQCLGWWAVSLMLAVLGAHFFRAGQYGQALSVAGILCFHCSRDGWKNYATAFFLLWGAFEWGQTVHTLILIRKQIGLPWARGALILSAVASLSVLSGFYAYRRATALGPAEADDAPRLKAGVFMLTFMLLLFARGQSPLQLLLLERYFPLWGGVQIFFLSWYAAYLTGRLIDRRTGPRARKKAWFIFSFVFFGQLVLGLVGFDQMLMTGKPHMPAPAFIIFSPLYRGEASFFMPGLLILSALLAGGSWCSFLCYFGPLDSSAASGPKNSAPLPPILLSALKYGRPAVLAIGGLTAAALGRSGLSPDLALAAAAVFIFAGFLVMSAASKKYSGMFHCTAFCPIGLIVNLLGRLSFWRIRVDADLCGDCGRCEKICLYRAISREDRKQGAAGFRCSTCRDCLGRCPSGAIYLWHPLIPRRFSEKALVSIAVILHVLFLGAARA